MRTLTWLGILVLARTTLFVALVFWGYGQFRSIQTFLPLGTRSAILTGCQEGWFATIHPVRLSRSLNVNAHVVRSDAGFIFGEDIPSGADTFVPGFQDPRIRLPGLTVAWGPNLFSDIGAEFPLLSDCVSGIGIRHWLLVTSLTALNIILSIVRKQRQRRAAKADSACGARSNNHPKRV